jgi:hypothetical protein
MASFNIYLYIPVRNYTEIGEFLRFFRKKEQKNHMKEKKMKKMRFSGTI